MNDAGLKLQHAPIIEAVLDIDCDLPLTIDPVALQKAAREALRVSYPKFRQQVLHEHTVRTEPDQEPEMQFRQIPGALQFLAEDEKQLVQFRPNGFSFNRLAPYSSLDDYLPEIQRAWDLFVELAQPVQIRKVGLRMINRMLLPMESGRVNFAEFLETTPNLPVTGLKLSFLGFLDQHLAVDEESGNKINIVKTAQPPEGDKWPLILDIDAFHECQLPPPEWASLLARIQSLRDLKNRVFRHTLTSRCLSLFSPLA